MRRCDQLKRGLFIVLICALFLQLSTPASAATVWEDVAQQKSLDPYELYAIALMESRRQWTDGLVRPWLYTLMIQGEKDASVFMPDKDSAVTLLELLLDNGINNVDVCCMQINLLVHSRRLADPTKLFEMRKCVEIGADILREALDSTNDKELALGRYHHWKYEKISRTYGKKVIVLANSLREAKIFGD